MKKDVLEEVIKKDLEEVIRVETLKKIRSIFDQMQAMRYSCYIDSLARIDEEIYDCENCALVDTVSRSVGCPLIIKENLKGVK